MKKRYNDAPTTYSFERSIGWAEGYNNCISQEVETLIDTLKGAKELISKLKTKHKNENSFPEEVNLNEVLSKYNNN